MIVAEAGINHNGSVDTAIRMVEVAAMAGCDAIKFQSYYAESLTTELEQRGWAFFEEIEAQGGFIASLDSGWLHQKAHDNQHAELLAREDGSRSIVSCRQNSATPPTSS